MRTTGLSIDSTLTLTPRTWSGGTHSAYCHLHPLFSQMPDLAKDKGDIEFANEMMHKIIEGLLKQHKNSKNNEK